MLRGKAKVILKFKFKFDSHALQSGSGFARGTTFRNVKMQNVSNPIIIDQNYCDSQKTCEKQVG